MTLRPTVVSTVHTDALSRTSTALSPSSGRGTVAVSVSHPANNRNARPNRYDMFFFLLITLLLFLCWCFPPLLYGYVYGVTALDSGKNDNLFYAGYYYNVRIGIYATQQINATATLATWKPGGDSVKVILPLPSSVASRISREPLSVKVSFPVRTLRTEEHTSELQSPS